MQQPNRGETMSIHSHIQIPKTILKHFRDESDSEKKVWYLDVKTNQIGKKSASRLGTSKGYYSKDGESYWSKTIEDPIGKLNQQVLAFCAGEVRTTVFHPEDMEVVKRYIRAAMVRSESAFAAMKTVIANPEKYTKQQLNDALSVIGMTVVGEITNELDFDKMVATILVNRTDRNFAVPRNCFYCVERAGYPNFIMPISPKGALLLMPRIQLEKHGGNYCVVDNSEQILRLNRHALKYESLLNGAFVAASCRSELEDLQMTLMTPPWQK